MENEKMIRLSGLIHESLVNGPGLRRVLFSQGCKHNCKSCFNPETHTMNGGSLFDMYKIIKDINDNPLISGVTFSGGDPWEQADKFAFISQNIKISNLNIWCYTGYTFEYILENKDKKIGWSDLLSSINVLVDGAFEQDKYDENLLYRGSSNQRIIDVKKSLEKGGIVIIDCN